MSTAVAFEDESDRLYGTLRVRAAPWRVAALLAAAVTPLLCGWLHTLHTLESLLLVALAILPAVSLTVAFLLRNHYGPERRQAAFAALTALLLGGAMAILFANQWLDASPVLRRTFTIESKAPGVGPFAAPFRVRIRPEAKGPLREAWLIERTEPINVDAETFGRVVAGQTTLTLSLHEGLFGLPWYEGKPSLDGLAAMRDAGSSPPRLSTLAD